MAEAQEHYSLDLTQYQHQMMALEQASQLRQQGDIAKCRQIAEDVLKHNADSVQAKLLLFGCMFDSGQRNDAVSQLIQLQNQHPTDPNIVNQLGLLYRDMQRFDDAITAFRQALRLHPGHAATHANLGVVFAMLKRFNDAVASFSQALNIWPEHPGIMSDIARCHAELGQYPKAFDFLRRVLKQQPQNPGALLSLATLNGQLGNHEEAAKYYSQLTYIVKDRPEIWRSLAESYRAVGKLDDALATLRRGLEQLPDQADLMLYKAEIHAEAKDFEASIEILEQLRKRFPEHPQVEEHLAMAYVSTQQWEKATEALRTSVRLTPENPMALAHLSRSIMHDGGELAESKQYAEKAVQMAPNHPGTLSQLALVCSREGDLDRTIQLHERALAANPSDAQAQFEYGWTLLLAGKLEPGWEKYEFRRRDGKGGLRDFPMPEWDGRSSVEGKTVIVHDEQGVGTTIQGIRYASLLGERGARVLVCTRNSLKTLFETLPHVSTVFTELPVPEPYDLQVPVMSLPHKFRTGMKDIPVNIPYLSSTEEHREYMRQFLPPREGRKRIGICWTGNPGFADEKNRQLNLEQVEQFSKIDNVQWVVLRMAADRSPNPPAPAGMEWVDPTPNIRDYADTAGLIDELDLLVSTDTGVVHLAGAMGRPSWCMLMFRPDWRWLLERYDNPWYPDVRLYRQPNYGQWQPVLDEIIEHLQQYTAGQREAVWPV